MTIPSLVSSKEITTILSKANTLRKKMMDDDLKEGERQRPGHHHSAMHPPTHSSVACLDECNITNYCRVFKYKKPHPKRVWHGLQ